jgi:hypothetical protein
MRKKDSFHNPGTDEKIILVPILKNYRGSLWTGVFVGQNRVRRQAPVSTARKLLYWPVILV